VASAGDVREYEKSTDSWVKVEDQRSAGIDIEHVTVERTNAALKVDVYLEGDAPLASQLDPGGLPRVEGTVGSQAAVAV
jgi:hypothetical protein